MRFPSILKCNVFILYLSSILDYNHHVKSTRIDRVERNSQKDKSTGTLWLLQGNAISRAIAGCFFFIHPLLPIFSSVFLPTVFSIPSPSTYTPWLKVGFEPLAVVFFGEYGKETGRCNGSWNGQSARFYCSVVRFNLSSVWRKWQWVQCIQYSSACFLLNLFHQWGTEKCSNVDSVKALKKIVSRFIDLTDDFLNA